MSDSKTLLYNWDGGNVALFKDINSIHGGQTYDRMMVGISQMADYHNFPFYLAGILLVMLLGYIIRKTQRRGGNKHYLARWIGVALVFTLGFGAEAVVIKSLKTHFSYTRPYAELPSGEVHVSSAGSPRSDEDSHHSFPSGHTAFATLVIFSLWPVLSKFWKFIGLLAVASVMWSRMALGMHFPADVLGAFVIMVIIVTLIRMVCYKCLRAWFRLSC